MLPSLRWCGLSDGSFVLELNDGESILLAPAAGTSDAVAMAAWQGALKEVIANYYPRAACVSPNVPSLPQLETLLCCGIPVSRLKFICPRPVLLVVVVANSRQIVATRFHVLCQDLPRVI